MEERRLYDAILHGRNTQRSELARLSALGNQDAPHGRWAIASKTKLRPQVRKEPVHPGRACAAIRLDAPPSLPEVVWMGDPVPHFPPAIVGMGSTPRVEPALYVEKPSLVGLMVGVHRPFLLTPALRDACFPSPCDRRSRPRTTTEAPPPPYSHRSTPTS